MSVKYNIIVAATEEGGIGLKNNLPWRLKKDMKYFKDVTTGNDKGRILFPKRFFFRLNDKFIFQHSQNECRHHGKKDLDINS